MDVRRFGVLALIGSTLLASALPAAALAFPLSTCTLSLTSLDASGATIDTAQSGAPDATQADPFEVEWDGSVAYEGSTGVVIKNYTYSVNVFGVPTPIRGGAPNEDENTEGRGSVGVAANSPFRVAGLYYVSGTYAGEGGSCAGSGWFRLRGDPVGTVPWILGVILVALGGLGLLAGIRGHALTAIAGGLLLGLGADLLLISHGYLPFQEATPLLVLALLTLAGVVVGLVGRWARRERAPLEGPRA